MEDNDRRALGTERVPVQTLVEICGRDVDGEPAFEAEALNVSGRGMQLRTAYLPGEGSPLVCRFEERGKEIVVEGVVAWRREAARGGEFGIQFTALDSGSVGALRDLCDANKPSSAEPEHDSEPRAEAASSPAPSDAGSKVRLHIDGLGSPMRARIRSTGKSRVNVGSNLEFLRVGRHLEVEDSQLGSRRGAQIDAVDVMIDPSTQVPQLVVTLRYDDADEFTPEPSVIDSAPNETARSPIPAGHMPMRPKAPDFGASAVSDEELEDDEPAPLDDEIAPAEFAEDDELQEKAEQFRAGLGVAATRAGEVAQKTGVIMTRLGKGAASGLGTLFKGAADKVVELRKKQRDERAPRRSTAPPPSGVLNADGRRLRPQSRAEIPASEAVLPSKPRRVKKIAALSAIAVLLATVTVIALRKPAAPPGAEVKPEAAAEAVALASGDDVTDVDEQGNPVKANAQPAKLDTESDDKGGITADVPLFGPTPMATMEPAPLDGPGGADEPGAEPEAAVSEEAQEMAAAKASPVEDESFTEAAPPSNANPSDVAPWGRGKMHQPTIHRIRLDGAGGAIQGAINPMGFTVVVPGRKSMESGRTIEKRDSRIARVRTKNSSSGAEISFQFRDGVPAYRVRLRKDFVEFLISAPAKSGVSSMSAKKSSKKSSSKKRSSKSSKKSTDKKR